MRVGVGALTLEVGGTTETVDVKGEAPLIQAHERRALVHRRDRFGRQPSARHPQFCRIGQSGAGRRPAPTASAAAARTNFMMDGVSTMDDGSNRLLMQLNVESIARSESAGLELSSRVRAVERPADHGGHQERHQPVSRLDLRRRAEFRLGTQQQDEQPQRQSQDGERGSATGDSRSAARSASPAAPTRSSSTTRTSSSRAPAATTSTGTACRRGRAEGRLLGDDRPERRAVSVHQGSEPHRHVRRRAIPAGLFR